MANTLGNVIGIIDHSFKVTNDNDESVTIRVKFDFTTSTDSEIAGWLVGNRVIAFQRPARSLTASEIRALDGSTVMASSAGAKIVSKDAKIRAAINTLKSLGEFDAANELEQKYNEQLEKAKAE